MPGMPYFYAGSGVCREARIYAFTPHLRQTVQETMHNEFDDRLDSIKIA